MKKNAKKRSQKMIQKIKSFVFLFFHSKFKV
jgi:hypothetical protein